MNVDANWKNANEDSDAMVVDALWIGLTAENASA